MEATIQQWGNSLAVRIPKAFAQQTRVKKGTRIHLTVEKDRMILTPVVTKEISLKSLLSRVTPRNVHPETGWGLPVGKEAW